MIFIVVFLREMCDPSEKESTHVCIHIPSKKELPTCLAGSQSTTHYTIKRNKEKYNVIYTAHTTNRVLLE